MTKLNEVRQRMEGRDVNKVASPAERQDATSSPAVKTTIQVKPPPIHVFRKHRRGRPDPRRQRRQSSPVGEPDPGASPADIPSNVSTSANLHDAIRPSPTPANRQAAKATLDLGTANQFARHQRRQRCFGRTPVRQPVDTTSSCRMAPAMSDA